MIEEKMHVNQAVLFAAEFVVQGVWDAEDFHEFFRHQYRAIFMLAWQQAKELERKRWESMR